MLLRFKTINFLFNIFKKTPAILMLDPGGIGDYILCRPFFKYVKESYKDYKIIYLCCEKQAELAKTYDNDYIDEVIVDDSSVIRGRGLLRLIVNSLNLKYDIKKLVNLRCLPLGDTFYRRSQYYFIKHIKAKEKLTGVIDFTNGYKDSRFKYYDRIFKNTSAEWFEIEHRRRFFEWAFDINIPEGVNTDLPAKLDVNKVYIAISLFATSQARMYSFDNWRIIINYLLRNFEDCEILFLGSKKENDLADKFICSLDYPNKCVNIAGQVSLVNIPEILRGCKLLISVETGTVHIAKAVKCPTVCLSNGMYYGHYQPYPDGTVKYIYPKEFENLLKNADDKLLKQLYKAYPNIDINRILPEEVINGIKELITT